MPLLDVALNSKLFYSLDDSTNPWDTPETIIFVHGFTESTEVWRCWIPHFARKYRVVRFDQRGFGRSGSVPDSFTYSTELLVSDLSQLIQTVSPDKPVHLIAGKSGNICAIATALAHPELVKTISMVSPAIKAPEATGWLEHIDLHGMTSWARWTMGDRLGSKMPKIGVEWWINLMGKTAASTAHAYLRWVSGVNLEASLPQVKQSVLIVGNESKRRGRAQFEQYTQLIPNAELAMIDVDGYHTGAVAPDQCSEVILDFLAKHPMK